MDIDLSIKKSNYNGIEDKKLMKLMKSNYNKTLTKN